jgi:ABC-type transporter Mla MlaB component
MFDLEFQTLTLTGQLGKKVTLALSQQRAEFMHLNGGIEPLIRLSFELRSRCRRILRSTDWSRCA